MANLAPESIEEFVNEKLKEDLRIYDTQLSRLTTELNDYTELKNSIETIRGLGETSFKTQVNIGGDFFLQAKVPDTEKILVNIGLETYVEFTLDEARRYVQLKMNVLEKQSAVIREEACRTKAQIKLALLVIGDKYNLMGNKENL